MLFWVDLRIEWKRLEIPKSYLHVLPQNTMNSRGLLEVHVEQDQLLSEKKITVQSCH